MERVLRTSHGNDDSAHLKPQHATTPQSFGTEAHAG